MNNKLTLMLAIIGIIFIRSALALTIDYVDVTPDKIAPGGTATVTIGIDNDGKEKITDVTVNLILREMIKDALGNTISVTDYPFAPVDSSEYNIDKIDKGDTEDAGFKIIALGTATTGVQKIPVKVTYTENGTSKTKDFVISLTIAEEPIIDASIENELLLKGQETQLSIQATNKGTSDVKFLEIELKNSPYYSVLSQNPIYIGDISSNNFDSAKFHIYINSNIPGTTTIPVKIKYRDLLNKEHVNDFDLQVKTYTTQEATQLGLMQQSNVGIYIIGIIIVIILYLVYRSLRKRLKRKSAK